MVSVTQSPATGTLGVTARAAVFARATARVLDPVLFSYSQILFAENRAVGAILLAATFARPTLGLFGLVAVLVSFAVVRLAHFSRDLAARGVYGYNPLLVGLAFAAFLTPSWASAAVALVAVVSVVFLQTALESALGAFYLPVLSVPFLVVTFLALAAAPLLPVGAASPFALSAAGVSLAARYLQALGAIFFQPELTAGLLVFLALLVYSRIAVLLSLVGFGIAAAIAAVSHLSSPAAPVVLAVNGIFLAIALGGVWFVPRLSSFVFAAVGVVVASFLGLASFMLLLPVALPTLILPFNLGVLGALYAMRQRVRDGAPKAVDFAAGTPEQNLNYYRTRVARFGGAFAVRLALPFTGRWTVTQGVDGAHTHKGPWRHGLDFEVLGPDGKAHGGGGAAIKDYHCYRLPVLASADGTVVKVVDGVPDNAPGKRNPQDNWGNAVVLQHGVGLFSLVAHLSPGTLEVTEGRVVRAGTRLGLCGASGRAFVPHVHFQLQASARVGAPTLPLELHDIVVEDEHDPRLRGVHVPAERERVRNLERAEDLARPFAFPLGSSWRFAVEGDPRGSGEETVTSQIDLLGGLHLESDRGDRLFYENAGKQLLVYDFIGRRASVLYLLYAAALRVPYDGAPDLAWSDVLARRQLRPRLGSWLADCLDPFLPLGGERLDYALAREAGAVVVRGTGRVAGRPASTWARFVREKGPVELGLELGGRRRTARLLEVHHEG